MSKKYCHKYMLTKVGKNKYRFNLDADDDLVTHIYDSIQLVIPLSRMDTVANELLFTCEDIGLLHKCIFPMPYHKIIHLIDGLSKQLNYMKSAGYGCYGFSLSDILTIDGVYIIHNPSLFIPLHRNSMFIIEPIKMPQFVSFVLTTLPTELHYKASYYSLGALVVYCLFQRQLHLDDDIGQIIEPLTNTKIFWFLKRCFETIPHKRQLLLI